MGGIGTVKKSIMGCMATQTSILCKRNTSEEY
uniref:Uncharacterized protein n=1 Tax=Anguilla anguilla TaxID=7936 RepID=A0A0E9TMD0_ANGAN